MGIYPNSHGRQFSTGKTEPEFMSSGLQYQPKPLINTRYPINTNTCSYISLISNIIEGVYKRGVGGA